MAYKGFSCGLEPKTHSIYLTSRLGESHGSCDHLMIVEEVNEAENRVTFSSNHDELWDMPLDEFKEGIKNARQKYGYGPNNRSNFCFGYFDGAVKIKEMNDHDKIHGQYVTQTTTKQPTCTSTGEAVRKCSLCGRTDTIELPKAAHDYQNGKITKKPKKGHWGTKTYTCTVCGEKVKIPIDSVKPKNIKAREGFKERKWLGGMATDSNTVSIGKEAYCGCKKLSQVFINSLDLKKIGKDAFKGVGTTTDVDVILPASRYEKYKSMIEAAGIGDRVHYYTVDEKKITPNNFYYDYKERPPKKFPQYYRN